MAETTRTQKVYVPLDAAVKLATEYQRLAFTVKTAKQLSQDASVTEQYLKGLTYALDTLGLPY